MAITGNGYKTLEAVASAIEQPSIIDARLKEFDALFDRLTNGKRTRRQRRLRLCLALCGEHKCKNSTRRLVPNHGSTRQSSNSTSAGSPAGVDEVPADGASIKAVIEDLERRHPGMRERLLDEKGDIRRFVNIYLNGDDIRFLDAINSKVKDGDDISIVPAIAGGR